MNSSVHPLRVSDPYPTDFSNGGTNILDVTLLNSAPARRRRRPDRCSPLLEITVTPESNVNSPHHLNKIIFHHVSCPYCIRLYSPPVYARGGPSIPHCPNYTASCSRKWRFSVSLCKCSKSWIWPENGRGRPWSRAWLCWVPEFGVVEAGGAM